MPRVRLIHWNALEAAAYRKLLDKSGLTLEYADELAPELMRSLKTNPPDALVIDLSRIPAHGREVAVAIRGSKATRQIPIVFCDGNKEKVESIRKQIPDAEYTVSSKLVAAIRRAMKPRRGSPIVPPQMMDRGAGRSEAQKLGIEAGSRLGLFALPKRAPGVLSQLPPDVELAEDNLDNCAVTLCFSEDIPGLQAALAEVRRIAGTTKPWVLWPKQASGKGGELTQQFIREQASELGLVDYKICSVDSVWSGMLFAIRK